MNVNYREELSTKLLFVLHTKFNIEVDELRPALDTTMSDYSIDKQCTALVSTDIPEKLKMFLSVKMLEGLSKGTLFNYRNEIINFSRYIYLSQLTV